MKVRDLIERLESLNSELEIVLYFDQQGEESSQTSSKVFEIVQVSESSVEKIRLPDGQPNIRFKKTADSTTLVIIEITSHF